MTIMSELIWSYMVNETILYHIGNMSQATNLKINNKM